MTLILASNSAIRRAMLDAAGIPHIARSPAFDEDLVKERHVGDDETLARRLAEGKALSVSVAGDDLVIGSDSVVSVDAVRYSKPRDRDDAVAHLRAFSGRTMLLSSAVALARSGKIDWSHAETAQLKVRPLSEAFIAAYLDVEWPEVAQTVGVFRMEARGATLFDKVIGGHFTILGMPLLALLGALRQRGILVS